MSVLASTWAWQQQIPPNLKLTLVALADHAHDDGAGAYPSKELLARKTGYTERQIQRNLKDLREAGVIRIICHHSRYRPTEYGLNIGESFVVTRGDKMSPLPEETSEAPRGDTTDVSGETPMSPEPSVEPSGEPSTPPAPADAGRRPNAGDLVAAWMEGAEDRGEPVAPTIVKRMKGQAVNVSKDLRTQEDWNHAVVAARLAGEQGLWDIAQGYPVARKSRFVDEKVLEQDAIFGPSAARARERMAAEQARIEAERAAEGS